MPPEVVDNGGEARDERPLPARSGRFRPRPADRRGARPARRCRDRTGSPDGSRRPARRSARRSASRVRGGPGGRDAAARCPAGRHEPVKPSGRGARVDAMADTSLDLTLDAAELTAQLVDFPSESGDEKPLADAVEAALRALPHLTVDRYGNNVVARTRLGRAERVVLAGHIDTVPIADNVPSRLDEDGVLWGCGTCDMKSGVAVQLRIAATVPEPNRDLTFVFYDNEEVAAHLNGLEARRRRPPGLAGGRLRGPAGTLRRPGRGRLPGHAAGAPEDHAASGPTPRAAGWGPTRSTRPPRSSPRSPRTSRATRSSTAWSTARA